MTQIDTVGRALTDVESAARQLVALFGGKYGRWTLDGRKMTDPVVDAMLILVDCLNTVDAARADPETVARYYREGTISATTFLRSSGRSEGDRMDAPKGNDPFTMEARLCDDDRMVSYARVDPSNNFATGLTYYAQLNNLRRQGGHDQYEGDPFLCTGHAHLAGHHIRCTSPAHLTSAIKQSVDMLAQAFGDAAEAAGLTDEQRKALGAELRKHLRSIGRPTPGDDDGD